MPLGVIGVLNVGVGDTKLTFDKNNPAECIRSARIVTDMLRRGYALMIQLPDGSYTRVREFREDVCEYVIADLDPIQAINADEAEHAQGEQGKEAESGTTGEAPREPTAKPVGKRGPKTRTISATAATGIAISRSAGG